MALFAKKEAPASDKISQNIDRLEEGIKNDIAWRDEMGAWSKRFGFAALGFVVLLVVAKAPILLAGAVISGVGFGVAKLVQNSYENSRRAVPGLPTRLRKASRRPSARVQS